MNTSLTQSLFWKLWQQINWRKKEQPVYWFLHCPTLQRPGLLRVWGVTAQLGGSPPWAVSVGQWMAIPLANWKVLYKYKGGAQ